MNLSPEWIHAFATYGIQALHWSTVGDPAAADQSIMQWVLDNQYCIFTHDLDFGALLALTQSQGPSVIQVRGRNVLPEHLGSIVCHAVQQYTADLNNGALIVIEEKHLRVRVLPIDTR